MTKIIRAKKCVMKEYVDSIENKMRDYLVNEISRIVKNKYHGKVLFKDGNVIYDSSIEIKSLFIDNNDVIWGEYKIGNDCIDITAIELKKAKYELVKNIILLFDNPSCIKPYYIWVAKNGENKVVDYSEGIFESEKQAYENMRDAVFNKVEYDTKYDEEYMNTDEYEEGTIDYSLSFNRNKIIANCYSGVITYEIFNVK